MSRVSLVVATRHMMAYMIRLAICGISTPTLRAQADDLAARLRGVTIVTDQWDAAVVLDTSPAIETCLASGKPTLVGSPRPELIRNTSPHLTIANAHRYLPSMRLIHQQLQAGKLGAPGLIRLHRWHGDEGTWFAHALMRDLDVIAWYFRAFPNVVFASPHARGTQIHLGFADGGMALIDHAAVPHGDRYFALTLIGSQGASYWDDQQNMQLVFGGEAAHAIRTEERGGGHASIVQDFVDGLGKPAAPDSPDWKRVLAVRDAIEESLRIKQPVQLSSPGA